MKLFLALSRTKSWIARLPEDKRENKTRNFIAPGEAATIKVFHKYRLLSLN